jgi:hypothetical protein
MVGTKKCEYVGLTPLLKVTDLKVTPESRRKDVFIGAE